jgi:hypothetical protein
MFLLICARPAAASNSIPIMENQTMNLLQMYEELRHIHRAYERGKNIASKQKPR